MTSPALPPQYLRGIELFNAGQFFACHEVWEELWQQAKGTEREFLHALIQVAAALHHYQRGNLKGAASVWQRAQTRLTGLPVELMQLNPQLFAAETQCFFEQVLQTPNAQFPFPKISLSYGSENSAGNSESLAGPDADV